MNIPKIGIGTYDLFDENFLEQVFSNLIDQYTLNIDTAQFYENEHLIGKQIKKNAHKRKQFFLTTKVNSNNIANENTYQSILSSCEKLNTDYLDLVLLHTPDVDKNKNIKAYEDLVKLQKQGIVKNIGVSNYSIKNIQDLYDYFGFYPQFNQIVCSPTTRIIELEQFCKQNNIGLIGYSVIKLYVVSQKYWYQEPMNQDEKNLIDEIAAKYNVTFSELLHSWALINGYNIIPKSTKVERLTKIFDNQLQISPEDMKKIDDMNTWTNEMYEKAFS